MRGILYSICIGSLALGLTAQGQEIRGAANVGVRARARPNMHATTAANTRAALSMRSRGNVVGTRFQPRRPVMAQTRARATVNRNNMRMNRVRALNERNMAVNQNASLRNRVSFSEAVNLHRHEFHDRDWWRRNFEIVIINNNAFFFDAGFWFPAWGYFPGAYYPYDGPIYAYNGLTPDQVVINVQVQLQRDGYYAGPIDGVLGSMTRDAIAAFQADHGLAVTAAIDQATVSTLGLT